MAKIGDLKDLLGTPDTPNHLKWLDVDGVDYREFVEALPKQNLQVIPDLEAAWSFLGDQSPYNLSSDHMERVSPFWSDVTPPRISDAEMEQTLLTYLRQNLSRGYTVAQTHEMLERGFSADVLKRHASVIEDTFKREAGLLGVVYDDARLYPRCASEKGKKIKTAARYLLAKSSCGSCVQHQNGRCAVMDKEIVFDVDYSEDLWDEIAPSKFISLEDKFAKLATLPVRRRIQVAHKMLETQPAFKRATWDNRPVLDAPAKLSDKQASEAVKNLKDTQVILGDVFAARKREVMAAYMMEHGTDARVRSLIASDKDLAPLKSHMHVLGSLYLDMSFFPTWDAAKTWTDKHASLLQTVPYVVGTPYGESAANVKNASRDAMHWTSADVLGSVTARFALAQGLTQDTEKVANFRTMIAKKSAEDVRKIAQKVYSLPLSKKAKAYDNLGMVTYDIKTGMTLKQAHKHLSLYGHKSYSTDGGKLQKQRVQIARVMATGQHDSQVQGVIQKHPHLASLRSHVWGHGKYYLDRNLFASAQDMELFYKRHASKRSLPVITEGNPWDHTQVRQAVLSDLKAVGIKIADLTSVEASKVQHLARLAQTRPKLKASYDDVEQKGRKVIVTAKDAQAAIDRIRAKRDAKVAFDATDYVRAPWVKRTAKLLEGDSKQQLRVLLAKMVEVEKNTVLPDSSIYNFHSVKKMAQAWSSGKPMRDHLATLKPHEVLSHAPIIAAFRNEEGLYGHAYMIADVYDDCKEGAKKAASTVTQVVRASKCESCIYRKESSCALYRADLVTDPVYTKQDAMRHAGLAHKAGRLDKTAFQGLLSDLGAGRRTPREVIRVANLSRVAVQVNKAAFSGEVNNDAGGPAQARQVAADPSKVLKAARLLVEKGYTRRDIVSRLQASFEPVNVKAAIKEGLGDILKQAPSQVLDLVTAKAHSNGREQMADLEIGQVNALDFEMQSTKRQK